jgi:transglutaminase-like putative cysteine protease
MQCVEYGSAPAREYSSRYEIDLWTNPYKTFVYPHRVDTDDDALQGTDYLADDPDLYNLSDTATYESFIRRVTAYIENKYGVRADMQNPYWAARNIVEYIQDNYYYPSRPKRKPATVDYDRQHYDANPGNLKIELSARAYDKTQIIACSGTSVMVAGAMRHLGIPARWLGTGTPRGPDEWDGNGNGLLDPDETGSCTNGHRYTQVWLGSHYGWICFDATPSKPALNDYDPPPPLQPQWRLMTRAAAGHREQNRIVFNIGSQLIRPLYRDFEYDELLAVDNNCGGDQRYNLQGRSEKSALWKLAGHRILVKNLCFISKVAVSEPGAKTRVAWQRDGAWDRIAGATVSVFLQQGTENSSRWRDVARLAKGIPSDAGSIDVDLSEYKGKTFRVIIRRDGDPETGGTSAPFDLN